MLTLHDIQLGMQNLKNWALDGNSILKEIEFKDFKEAMQFVNKVSEIAENKGHHPDIFIFYNKVRLILTTHSSGGLTEKDFELAEEIDKIDLGDSQH